MIGNPSIIVLPHVDLNPEDTVTPSTTTKIKLSITDSRFNGIGSYKTVLVPTSSR